MLLNWYKRNVAKSLFQRPVKIDLRVPHVSFSFDDFPQSALRLGGAILRSHGLKGTYFVSLGLLGSDSPSGLVCTAAELAEALGQGHELGCHTFAHCDSWETDGPSFEASILKNRAALSEIIPGARFNSFAYPLSTPSPSVKRASARHFACCRAGGQTINEGTVDLNQLSAYFLEKAHGEIEMVKDLIEANKAAQGWLIFATHDVAPEPSPYGCTPEFFDRVVQCSLESGARVLPVTEALNSIQRFGAPSRDHLCSGSPQGRSH